MTKPQSLPTSADPKVLLEVHGDLRLEGGDPYEIAVEGDEADLLPVGPDEFHIVTGGDVAVRVPRRAQVRVSGCNGDARLKGLESDLDIRQVGGDLILRQLVSTTIGQVGGDVSAKKIRGALSLTFAGGDVSARGVAGPFNAAEVGGDLALRDLEASAAGQARGDLITNMAFHPGQTYELEALGDVICRVPTGASVTFEIDSKGEVSWDVSGARVEGQDGALRVIVGAGEAVVKLSANGDVTLSDITTNSSGVADSGDDFGERVAAEVEAKVSARLAEVERELNMQFGNLNISLSGLGGVDAERIAAKVRRVAESTRRRNESAQRKAEALSRKAETLQRKVEQMTERTGRRKSWGFTFSMPTPPRPPVPPVPPRAPGVEPISEDERLTILRMLEQGKISAADAEQLLAALEGKTT